MDEKARKSKEPNQALGYENKDLDAAVRLYKLVSFKISKKTCDRTENRSFISAPQFPLTGSLFDA